MKTISQNILFWCLLAAFVPCVLSATIPPNSDGEKKVNAEYQKKDLCVHNRTSEDSVENRDTGPPISQTSDQPSGRMKRGCNLLTCSIHDLAYRINQLSNKTSNAPPRKISPCGYGRRRRRSLLRRSTTPTHGDMPILETYEEAMGLSRKLPEPLCFRARKKRTEKLKYQLKDFPIRLHRGNELKEDILANAGSERLGH